MKRTKKFYITLGISIFLTLAVLTVGTIFDLQISESLADLTAGQYYSQNLFAIICECVGEDVLYIILLCAFAIVFFYLSKFPISKKWLNITLKVLLVVASLICSFYALNKTLTYISNYTNFGLGDFVDSVVGKLAIAGFSAVVAGLILWAFSNVDGHTISSLTGWALAVLIVALVSNLIVQGSKIIFDRARYRAMVYEGYTDFEYYTKWFQINSNKFSSVSAYVSDYFKSFPSGHTCAAASTFLLILLPDFWQKVNTKGWKIFFYSFATIYTLTVAISRIIAGAHFFTDVFISGMVTVVCVLLIKLLFVKKFKSITKNTRE
jgi:membrane-associated phospholipid phosphatase